MDLPPMPSRTCPECGSGDDAFRSRKKVAAVPDLRQEGRGRPPAAALLLGRLHPLRRLALRAVRVLSGGHAPEHCRLGGRSR